MANSQIAVTEGTGKNVATYSFTEGTTKELSRVTINSSAGTEVTFNSNGTAATESSAPVTVANDQTTVPVAFDTAGIMNANAGVKLTPVKLAFGVSTSGANTLVAGTGGKKIRVLSIVGVPSSAVTVYFKDSNATNIFATSGTPMSLSGAGNGLALGFNPLGWFETGTGFDLIANLGGSVGFSGVLTYVLV